MKSLKVVIFLNISGLLKQKTFDKVHFKKVAGPSQMQTIH